VAKPLEKYLRGDTKEVSPQIVADNLSGKRTGAICSCRLPLLIWGNLTIK